MKGNVETTQGRTKTLARVRGEGQGNNFCPAHPEGESLRRSLDLVPSPDGRRGGLTLGPHGKSCRNGRRGKKLMIQNERKNGPDRNSLALTRPRSKGKKSGLSTQ